MTTRHRPQMNSVLRMGIGTADLLLAALPARAQPVPTTTSATGFEDQAVLVVLGSVDDQYLNAPVLTTITQVPPVSMGQCQQFDGTPITAAPAVVTDPKGRVRFIPSPNENGSPLASLVYTATNLISGKVSMPRSVALGVRPVNDAPTCANSFSVISPAMLEDQPRYVQINVNDPDLSREGDTSTVTIVNTVAPIFMAMYQVGDDNVTIGAQIPSNTVVTNPDRWVYCVPNGNYWGNSTNLVWKVTDGAGVSSPELLETISIGPTNDPPFANNTVMQGTQLTPVVNVQLSYNDIDVGVNESLTLTFTSLPTKGELYVGSVAPQNLLTPTNNTAYGYGVVLKYKKIADGLGSPFDSFAYTVTDSAGATASATGAINFVYVNVPPVPQAPDPITLDEDSGWTEMLLSSTDIDSPASETHFYITELPTSGQLQVRNILNTAWVPVPVPNTLAGPLGPTVLVRYKPLANANTLGAAPDFFKFKVSDNLDEHPVRPSVFITIKAFNDQPVISGPAVAIAHITVPGGQHVNAVVTTLSVSDDAGDQPIDVTITSTLARSLFLNSTAGLAEFDQLTPTSMIFTGTVSAVNAVFAAGLQFDPSSHGTGSITVTVNDMGNTGEESPPVPLSGTFHVTVPIVP